MNPLTYCTEDDSATVHIARGRRGRAKPACGPWWKEPTPFHRVDAERPTCRICLRILGDSVGSPRVRLSTPRRNSAPPLVHVARSTDGSDLTPRCGARMVVERNYEQTADVVTCSHCLGITRRRK